MILSDLIAIPVVSGGEELGHVIDARFAVPSDSTTVRGDARLIGFIVSRRNSASYLGYERNSVRHPWLIARYLAWRHREAFLLKWEDIDVIGRDAVRVRAGFTHHDPALD